MINAYDVIGGNLISSQVFNDINMVDMLIYGGPYVPFDEFRLPTFLTSSDFFDEFQLF